MLQTCLLAAAAIQLIGVACSVNASRPLAIFFFQFTSVTLAVALSVVAFGKFMGWPV